MRISSKRNPAVASGVPEVCAVQDDGELIAETLAGDRSAYGQLVRRYQDRLFGAVMQVVRSREEAEDVVQDAFVKAYLKLETFQQSSAFYTWLYRIAFNAAVSRGRRKRPEASVEVHREASGGEPIDESEDAGERLLRQERAEQLQAALDGISEEHRAILVLREMEGFCYEEIAEVLDLPVGTVRSRLHRARLQLKSQLEQMMPQPHDG